MSDSDYRKTSFLDIRKGAESREYKVHTEYVEHPSSVVWKFTCPWCLDVVKAYLWSLCGGGKRCKCGAIFGARGMGYKVRALSAPNRITVSSAAAAAIKSDEFTPLKPVTGIDLIQEEAAQE